MSTPPLPYSFEEIAEAWRNEYPSSDLEGFLIGAVLMRMGRIIEQDFTRRCAERFDLTGPEMVLLFTLRRLGAPYAARPTQLKHMLLLTSGAVTKQISRLCAKQLVRRDPDPNSRNGQIISLTAKGRKQADAATLMLEADSIACESFRALPADLARSGQAFCSAMIDLLERGKSR